MDDVLALITAADCWPQSWQQPNRKFLAQSQQIFTSLMKEWKKNMAYAIKDTFTNTVVGNHSWRYFCHEYFYEPFFGYFPTVDPNKSIGIYKCTTSVPKP